MANPIDLTNYHRHMYAPGTKLPSLIENTLSLDTDGLIHKCFFSNGDFNKPPNKIERADTKKIILNYDFASFPINIDILRNEKPLYISFNEKHPTDADISTSDEPLGEGEN
jgi:hypothetical protein